MIERGSPTVLTAHLTVADGAIQRVMVRGRALVSQTVMSRLNDGGSPTGAGTL